MTLSCAELFQLLNCFVFVRSGSSGHSRTGGDTTAAYGVRIVEGVYAIV